RYDTKRKVMKQILVFFVLGLSGSFVIGEEMNRNSSEITNFLKQDSIGGYDVKGLLSNNEGRPKNILGVSVQYFDSETSFLGASAHVTIQFSKKGYKIQTSEIMELVKDFKSLNTITEFEQTDFTWTSGEAKCSISVHTGDDIFEYSCWK